MVMTARFSGSPPPWLTTPISALRWAATRAVSSTKNSPSRRPSTRSFVISHRTICSRSHPKVRTQTGHRAHARSITHSQPRHSPNSTLTNIPNTERRNELDLDRGYLFGVISFERCALSRVDSACSPLRSRPRLGRSAGFGPPCTHHIGPPSGRHRDFSHVHASRGRRAPASEVDGSRTHHSSSHRRQHSVRRVHHFPSRTL